MGRSNTLQGKTRQEKLEYFNSLQYDITLKRKKGKFHLIIPELPLLVAHENLEEAYKELCEQKQRLFSEMLDCDAEDEITIPRRTRNAREELHQLKIFVYKLLIICFLLGTTLVFGGRAIMDKVTSISAGDIAKSATKSVVSTFIDAPESAKEMRIKRLRQFLKDLHPVIEELKSAFSPLYPEGEVGRDIIEK